MQDQTPLNSTDNNTNTGLSTEQQSPQVTSPPSSPSPSKKSRTVLIIVLIVVLLAAAGFGLYTLLKKDEEPKQADAPNVKVGFMMATSGGAASMGQGAIKGVQLAMKELGADNIQLIQVDSKCEKEAAVSAVKELIAQNVVAIIGEGCSSATTAALPEANKAKIPMVSPSASNPSLSIPDDYFFRTIPNDNFGFPYLAEYAYGADIKKVAMFHTIDPAGTAPLEAFESAYEAAGGTVTAVVGAEPEVTNLSSQADQLIASKPDAVLLAVNTLTSATAMMKLLDEKGYTGKYLGGDAMYDQTVITEAGDASEGLVIYTFTLGTKAFKQSLANEYGSSESAYAAPQAYDALHAILEATRQGADTGEEVQKLLPSIQFDGASDYRIRFDKNGEISGEDNVKYSLLEVKGGSFVEIEQ